MSGVFPTWYLINKDVVQLSKDSSISSLVLGRVARTVNVIAQFRNSEYSKKAKGTIVVSCEFKGTVNVIFVSGEFKGTVNVIVISVEFKGTVNVIVVTLKSKNKRNDLVFILN